MFSWMLKVKRALVSVNLFLFQLVAKTTFLISFSLTLLSNICILFQLYFSFFNFPFFKNSFS